MINSIKDLRRFATALHEELKRNNEYELASELIMWEEDVFTSTTELLGELMLILEKVNRLSRLTGMKPQIEECLTTIKRALGQKVH